MNKHFYISFFFFLFILIIIGGCKKDVDMLETNTIPQPLPKLIIKFDNKVGDSALVMDTLTKYVNANNDTFSVSGYKYYISNVQLTDVNGNVYSEPYSYHLIDAYHLNTCKFGLPRIPDGKYTSISFLIGVDSAHNDSGPQTGALDPVWGMFWTWNSGYIMAVLSGTSPQSPNLYHIFSYSLIGYIGPYNIIKSVTIPFNSDTAVVRPNHVPVVSFKSDILEWFKTPTLIMMDSVNSIGDSGPQALNMANNYADMFSYEGIHN